MDDRLRAAADQRIPVPERMLRWILSVADRRPGLSILLFHRVLAVADPFRTGDMTAAQFGALVTFLARTFSVVPLEEAIERLRANALPKAALAITFDDGYRDNLDIAAPILAAQGLAATFFIATGFLDGTWMWNDRIIESCRRTCRTSTSLPALGSGSIDLGTEQARVAAAHRIIDKAKHLPYDERATAVAQLEEQLDVRLDGGPMLDSESVRRLRRMGMSIGAHTVSHPILARIDDARARVEIHESRAHLLEVLREPVRLFAYPNGRPDRDYRMEHVRMVAQAGFDGAVSTNPTTVRPGMSQYELPRFTPWEKVAWRFAARLGLTRLR